MSLPKFVQIEVQSRNDRIVALGEDGTVWIWDDWRVESAIKRCWNCAKTTLAEAFPPPPEPKPTLDDCLIQPPTLEDEARDEVERMLRA